MSALDLCNCCDVEPAAPVSRVSRAGYCRRCAVAAQRGGACWHDDEEPRHG